jgi:VIT1/CCC1 family predicted Fe2+/Mn2+ transporter
MTKEQRLRLIKAFVLGANDGIITTFAVVAGVVGANLPAHIILILGIANMIADGISMSVGDYLGERSAAQYEKSHTGEEGEVIWKSSIVTFVAFVVAGSLPLAPYVLQFMGLPIPGAQTFMYSIICTGIALFSVGSLGTIVTRGNWLKSGLEMLSIGAIAAVVAYALGAFIEQLISK